MADDWQGRAAERPSRGRWVRFLPVAFAALLIWDADAAAQERAFPEAEGGGALATGGRGGAVCNVTTTGDTGGNPSSVGGGIYTGTFRQCVTGTTSPSNRTVVFRTGGTIALGSPIGIPGAITIAGQTAPGGGIQISGDGASGSTQGLLNVNGSDDVIVRYIRVRTGDGGSWGDNQGDAFSITGFSGSGNISDVILDHVSLQWARDENMEIYNSSASAMSNITVQFSIVAESLWGEAGGTASGNFLIGSNGSTQSVGMTNIDAHHNFLAHGGARNPFMQPNTGAAANNIIYNWDHQAFLLLGGTFVDIDSNVLKSGSDSFVGADFDWWVFGSGGCSGNGCINRDPEIYLEGNIVNGTDLTDDWDNLIERPSGSEGGVTTAYRVFAKQSRTVPVTVAAATTLQANLLPVVGVYRHLDDEACDGSWEAVRDAVDARLADDFVDGTGAAIGSEGEVGGYPTIATGTACTDADLDGMPAVWEAANGLSDGDASDRNATGLAEGDPAVDDHYTNLEIYLDGITIQAPAGCQLFEAAGAGGTLPSPWQHPVDATYGQKIHVDCDGFEIVLGSCANPADATAAGCNDDLFFAATALIRVTGAGQPPRWVERPVVCGKETGADDPPNECPAGPTGFPNGTRATIDLSQATLVAAGVIPGGADPFDHVHLVRILVCEDSGGDGTCDGTPISPSAEIVQAFEP